MATKPPGNSTAILLRWLALEARWVTDFTRLERQFKAIKPEFDPDFYRAAYPSASPKPIDPLKHYIVFGWRAGLDPNERFSTRYYLENNPDLADAGVNPYFHYLRHGRDEGRKAALSQARRDMLSRPTTRLVPPAAPPQNAFESAFRRTCEPGTPGAVDVIVPVYKGYAETAACLHSVLSAHNERPIELVVIDDCSPESGIRALLRGLAASQHIRLVEASENRGFVASVNAGMALHPERDVVLLNADTLVADGWLDRLAAHADRDAAVATVTPFSNNATICSYPDFGVDNPYELPEDAATLDRLAASANAGRSVEIPTAVGFCMFIRRAALEEIGLFDVARFGFGYGEENDFCMRALKRGWRHLLATDVYVRHFGSVSFGAGMPERSRIAQQTLARLHPDYQMRVKRHMDADPALAERLRLDVARLREALGPISVVFVSHNWGGGIDTYLANLTALLERHGHGHVAERALVARARRDGFLTFERFVATGRPAPYLPNLAGLNVERQQAILADVFRLLDPQLIHVDSFAGLAASSIAPLVTAVRTSGVRYWHVWHDHQPLCPRVNFVDAENRYCGEPGPEICRVCLSGSELQREWVDIDAWRAMFRTYLAGAERVIAPTRAAAERAARLVDRTKIAVVPHAEPLLAGLTHLTREPGRRELRVAVVGAIGPHKGADLLLGMIRDAVAGDRPIRFHIVGHTALRQIANGPKSVVSGRYARDEDAVRLLHELKPDVFLLTSVWPETFVYTLSLAMALGLPAVAFDLGAQGERLRSYPRGVLLDPELRDDPVAMNDALLALDLDRLWAAPLLPGQGLTLDADRVDLMGMLSAGSLPDAVDDDADAPAGTMKATEARGSAAVGGSRQAVDVGPVESEPGPPDESADAPGERVAAA